MIPNRFATIGRNRPCLFLFLRKFATSLAYIRVSHINSKKELTKIQRKLFKILRFLGEKLLYSWDVGVL